MENSIVVAILAALGTFVVFILNRSHPLINALFTRWEKRIKNKQHDQGIIKIGRFYRSIDHIFKLEYVSRILLFVGADSGRAPDPTRPYHVKCIKGWFDETETRADPEALYALFRPDTEYVEMLVEMIENGFSSQVVANMLPCKLKEFYMHEGIVHSYLFYMQTNDNELTFVSVASHKAEFTNFEAMIIKSLIQEAKDILE